MKKLFILLTSVICSAALYAAVEEVPYADIAQAVSSGAPTAKRLPQFALDGSGLAEDGSHGVAADNKAWVTANSTNNTVQDCKQWFAVEFNEAISLSKLHIWNLNWTKYSVRGVKDIEIYVSSSTATDAYNTIYTDAIWTKAGEFTVAKAPEAATYMGEELVLNAVAPNVKWVLIRIVTNYMEAGTGDHYCGISELKFYKEEAEVCTPNFGLLVNGTTYYPGTENTDMGQWEIKNITLAAGDLLQAKDTCTGAAWTPAFIDHMEYFGQDGKLIDGGVYSFYLKLGDGDQLYIVKESVSPTALDDVRAMTEVKKLFINGQLVIVRDGMMFNAIGQQIQ